MSVDQKLPLAALSTETVLDLIRQLVREEVVAIVK